jgi:hypothetical protein
MERAIEPRNIRVFINVTADLKKRLEAMAEKRGWSLSKTGYMVMMRGLAILEQNDDIQTYMETGSER